MNSFDAAIIHFLNRFSQKSWCIDVLMAGIVDSSLLKGVVIVTIFWWAWFRASQTKTRDRELILSAIVVSSAALFVARTWPFYCPFACARFKMPLFISAPRLGRRQAD